MARIRLQIREVGGGRFFPASYVNSQGAIGLLPRLRLRVKLLVGPDLPVENSGAAQRYDATSEKRLNVTATVDTGAFYSVIPRSIWELPRFAPFIERFELNPEEMSKFPEAQRIPRHAVAGGTFSYFIGRVWLGAFDLEDRRLPAVPVIAFFLDAMIPSADASGKTIEPPVLIGIQGGFFDGRWLERQPVLERHLLEPPGMETFGQSWWLRDC